jgi:tRNA (guanine37-N1)-methyltransferase
LLAGNSTKTIHREYGYSYHLDPVKVFFSPGLAGERHRIAKAIGPGERVLVPCSGVGPFAIPAAAAGADVIAIETNPDACRYLAVNARENHVHGNISIILGDAFSVIPAFRGSFDRVIIPTPYGMDDLLDCCAAKVRSGGRIHFYTFKKKHQIPNLPGVWKKQGLLAERVKCCGNVAPCVVRVSADLRVL